MKNTILLLTVLAVLLTACKDPFFLEDKKNTSDKTRSLEFVEIFNSNQAYQNDFNERKTVVVKSQAELEEFLSKMTGTIIPSTEFPKVDFNEKMLLGIVFPEQSSGSHKLTITEVNMVDGVIEVSSELFIPGIGTDDIGYPVVFVEIKKLENNVEFLPTDEILAPVNDDAYKNKIWKLKYTINPNGSITDPEFYRDADSQWQRVFLEPFTINFKNDNSVDGKSNCNTWGGNYNISNETINIFDIYSTEVKCAYSDKFQSLILNAQTLSYSNDSLYINSKINDEIYTLVFYYFNPEVENVIPRSAWKLSTWSNDGGITYSSAVNASGNEIYFIEHDFSLIFDNGLVTGNAKCEYIESNYSLDLNNKGISFQGFTSNETECGFNKEFISLLNNSTSYDLKLGSLNMLTLYDNDKKNILRFNNDFTLQSKWLSLDETFELESVATISKNKEISNIIYIENSKYILNTKPNFTISGSGECNTFNGSFINYNDFGETSVNIATTKVNCDEFETHFFNCLESTTNFKWVDEKLILYNFEEGKEFNYLVFKLKN